MIKNIPLNQLVISPLNVRKTSPSEAAQDELMASIQAHGLLENLIVQPGENNIFEVLAGGRRLLALQTLAERKHLSEGHPIACLIHEGDAQEISLAENVVRLSMHALDQFEAFRDLSDNGQTISQIAERFGHSEHLVRQRLRLGRVAFEIREAYRVDEINLETLMAFALTEDTEQQMAVWNEIRDGQVTSYTVRRMLTEEKIIATSQYVRFIGIEAYKEAGGTIKRDLFSQDDEALHLDDRALVMKLVQEKLTTEAEKIQTEEGWKWSQAHIEMSYELTNQCQTVYPEAVEPTEGQTIELEQLNKNLELFEAMDEDQGLSTEEEDKVAKIEERIEEIESSLRSFSPDDLAKAGCMVSVAYDGTLSVRRGLVLPEDQEKKAKAKNDNPNGYSRKLEEDLGHFRLEVAQAHLAKDYDCAFDLMVFTLAHTFLNPGYYAQKPLNLQGERSLPYGWSKKFDTVGAELPSRIDLDFLERPPEVGFEQLSSMSTKDKQDLFAYCTALMLNGGLADEKAGLHDQIGARLNVNVAGHWRPTAESFFKRVKKDQLLEIGADVLGDKWALMQKGEKKGDLADSMGVIFSGQRVNGVSAEQAAAAVKWVPKGMAYLAAGDETLSDESECDLPAAFRA